MSNEKTYAMLISLNVTQIAPVTKIASFITYLIAEIT